jgi:hypothetical protein
VGGAQARPPPADCDPGSAGATTLAPPDGADTLMVAKRRLGYTEMRCVGAPRSVRGGAGAGDLAEPLLGELDLLTGTPPVVTCRRSLPVDVDEVTVVHVGALVCSSSSS